MMMLASQPPWKAPLGLPFLVAVKKGDMEAKVPCTGYPTPGVVNGKTGAVIDPDVFGKVEEGSLDNWLAQA